VSLPRPPFGRSSETRGLPGALAVLLNEVGNTKAVLT
jgi:hypothetical protein